MTYIKQIYTAFIRVSGLKLWALGDCNCAILLRGCAPHQNSAIAVSLIRFEGLALSTCHTANDCIN